MAQRSVNPQGIDLVKSFEGIPDGNPATVNIDPYLDPVNVWTIGWGHALRAHGRLLRGPADAERAHALYPNGLTVTQADQLLQADLMDVGGEVLAAVKVPLNDNEYAALVSFTFNLGAANLLQSTLLRKLNSEDRGGAAREFERWVLADGHVLNGLVRRRQAERALFQAPV